MDELTITTEDGDGQSPEESSAHEAAVAEGATQVHAGNAEQASEEAKQAAEASMAAAAANVEATVAANEAAERAEAAADRSEVTLGTLHEALMAQQTTLNTFMEEMRAAKKPAPKTEPVERSHDEPPSSSKKKRGQVLFGR